MASKVQIVSWFGDGEKRPAFEGTVRDLLDATPERYLVGLESVSLRDETSLTRAEKREKVRTKSGLRGKSEVTGLYRAGRGKSGGAKIELFIDKIFAPFPPWLPKIRFLRRLCLAKVIYHELGHHIHESGSSMGNKEAQAEVWEDRLLKDYLARRHPLVVRLARPIATILRWVLRVRRRTT